MTPVDTDLLVPPAHFGFLASPAIVFVLGFLVPGVGIAWTLGRALAARSWQRRADHAVAHESSALVAGPAVLVGEVLTEDGDSPEPGVAIKVVLRQHSDGTTAREVDRKTSAGPFYLRTEGGEIVRVEPGAAPTLASPLATEPAAGRSEAFRYRAAVLREGERAICAGRLVRGFNPRAVGTYRAAEGGWVLSAGRGNMWVSGASLGELFRRKARFFFAYAAAFAAVLLVAQALFFPFYRAAATGNPVRCTVTGTLVASAPIGTTRLAGYCDDGYPLAEPARRGLVDLVAESDGVTVTVLRTADGTTLGPVPTVSWLRVALLVTALGGAVAVALAFAGLSSRSWYERRKVDESLVAVV